MASINDYDPDLAGDTVTATGKKKQTSFDQANLPAQYQQSTATPAAGAPGGPVGRAAMQLPATSVTADAPVSAQSLESLRPTGIGDGRSAIYAGVGANGEASFSNLGSTLNTASKNFTAPNQPADQRLSSMPGFAAAGSPEQQPPQRFPSSLSDLSPGGPSTASAAQPPQRPASLADAMPGYAQSSVAQSPTPQPQANLTDAWRSGASSGPGFAALGSSANMGDGVGTFSQSNQGDAQLALTRFQRANDLRAGYRAEDKVDLANTRAAQGATIGIVRDSSKPLTRADVAEAQLGQQQQAGLERNAIGAQRSLENLRAGQVQAGATRQNQRLEDAWTASTGPGATDAQRQAYRSMIDPFNKQGLAQQLTQADIAHTQASTAKLTNEANPTGAPKLTEGQSKDYNYYERGNAANGELASNGMALTSAATGDRGTWRGITDSLIRGLPGGVGNSSLANSLVSSERQRAEQSGSEYLNALLRKDSGAALTQEEKDIYGKTYLPQSGDSPEVIKQKEAARTRSLQSIRGGLGNVANITSPVNQGGAPAGRAGPAVGTVMQGHVFQGGDPANPASWRRQ
ncbi:hypothetical protein [Pseudomonas sp. PS02290]|uniref:hypothetical protein n=1 Tax=Pseudomonas sp. PS02290 TaxID=2991430 RepID=UPI00249A500C|nr:hypothetical protein [Pseudomonas sp. PS02290]